MPSARPPAPAHLRQPGHTSSSRSKNPSSEPNSQNRRKTLLNHLTDSLLRWWLGEIGPAPHLHFATHEKLASWVTLCPGNNISARKRKHGRTGDAGTCIKPMLVQAAWAAIRVRGRLQARYSRLVRRSGGDKNPGAKKKAITAIAHTLLKIAYQVLKTGTPYQEPGADFYTRRESPGQKQAWLERQMQKLHPGCAITITIGPPEAALPPGG